MKIFIEKRLKDSFSAKKKAGAVFVDLTAACDALWHCCLICKLLRLRPDRHTASLTISFQVVAVQSIVPSASQLDPANCLKSPRRDVMFLRSDSSILETRVPYPAVCQDQWVQHKTAEPVR